MASSKSSKRRNSDQRVP